MAHPSNEVVYQLHIQLAYIEPPIWRRIMVSGQITLLGLHQMLQVVMGWENSHLHQFIVGKTYYGEPDPEYGGGIGGYAHLLEALKDRRHPEHKELRAWVGKHYDPELFSVQQVNSAF